MDTLLDAFRTNSRNIIGRNPSMVILLIANQDLTPMLLKIFLNFKDSEPEYSYKPYSYENSYCIDGEKLNLQVGL